MTVRFYSSYDTGAPTPSGIRVTALEGLRTILMACLVDGYNEKPGAGWTIGHNVDTGFSLGNGDGYINVVEDDVRNCAIYIMEQITNGLSGLAEGINRRSSSWSDNDISNSSRQWMYLGVAGQSNGTWHWSVIADEYTAHLVISGVAGGSWWGSLLTFGRYNNVMGHSGPGSFYSLGGCHDKSSNRYFGVNQRESYCGTLLRHPFTGLVDQGLNPKIGALVPSLTGSAYELRDRTKLQITKLHINPVSVMGYGQEISGDTSYAKAIRLGFLRGFVSDPFVATLATSNIMDAFGDIASDTYRFRHSLFDFPGGARLSPAITGFNNCGVSLLSMDESAWL